MVSGRHSVVIGGSIAASCRRLVSEWRRHSAGTGGADGADGVDSAEGSPPRGCLGRSVLCTSCGSCCRGAVCGGAASADRRSTRSVYATQPCMAAAAASMCAGRSRSRRALQPPPSASTDARSSSIALEVWRRTARWSCTKSGGRPAKRAASCPATSAAQARTLSEPHASRASGGRLRRCSSASSKSDLSSRERSCQVCRSAGLRPAPTSAALSSRTLSPCCAISSLHSAAGRCPSNQPALSGEASICSAKPADQPPTSARNSCRAVAAHSVA
eukprot:scaffold73539_cov53-Phaeocystis_antarctica.AAC.1